MNTLRAIPAGFQIKRNSCLRVLALASVILVLQLSSVAQTFKLVLTKGKNECWVNEFYKGVIAHASIKILGTNLSNVKDFSLFSDSLSIIKKKKSNLFEITPIYNNSNCTIFLVDTKNNRKIDSISVAIRESPFFFQLSNLRAQHNAFDGSNYDLQGLYIYSRGICEDFSNGVIIQYYTLMLTRSDSIIGSVTLSGNNLIPKKFKKMFNEKRQNGDKLIVEKVHLKDKNSKTWVIPKFEILTIRR